MRKVLFLTFVAISQVIAQGQTIFTQPVATFINKPTETIIDLRFNSPTLAALQTAINNARSSNASAVIRITLTGFLDIANTPLTLSDKTQLVLDNGVIRASNTSSATALVVVDSSRFVTITTFNSGQIDGKGKNLKGIEVKSSGKTHIDNLTVKDCLGGGIVYQGKADTVYADAGSTTRCTITNCGVVGILFEKAFHFICTDNSIKSCSTGISVNGNNSVLANNTISLCTTGITSFSQNPSFAYNKISNCGTAIGLESTSNETLISHNSIKNNATGFRVNGSRARVYHNDCANTIEVIGTGTKNDLYANKGITPTEGTLPSCNYFNPPLINNQHSDLIKIGKTRFDITINGGYVKDIRKKLDSLHTAKPTAVLVAHLNGRFTTFNKSDSLFVKQDECFLLNGSIESTDTASTILHFNTGLVSFSGGTIDGKNVNGRNALILILGGANVILDSVKVKNSKGEGISKKGNNFTPTYIRACSVDSSKARGIWALGSSRLFAFENSITNSNLFPIDLDAFTSYCVLMKNKCIKSNRFGIFIEEGSKNNLCLGNICTGHGMGIGFYNLAVNNQYTSRNLIVSNICRENNRGILLNAADANKATIDNVIFNNILENNTDVGLGGYYNTTRTYNNYNAFNTIRNNTNGSFASIDFVINSVWNMVEAPPTVTSIEEFEHSETTLLAYPNPNHGHFKVILPKGTNSNLELYNSLGQIVYQGEHSTVADLHLPELSKGVYILKVKSAEATGERKIILE